jgi:hypothetical protein
MCLNPVSLELGIMTGGLIIGGCLFFFAVHLIGEKLNKTYRQELKETINYSAEIVNHISPPDDVTK